MKPGPCLSAVLAGLALLPTGCQNGPRAQLRRELEQTRAELAQVRATLKDRGGDSLKAPDDSTFEVAGEVFVNDKTGPRVVGAAEILVFEKEAFETWLAQASRKVVGEFKLLQTEVEARKLAQEETEKRVALLAEKLNKPGSSPEDFDNLARERGKASEAEDTYVEVSRRLDSRDQTNALFGKLPLPAFRTESDSKGRFSLRLPKGKSYVLVSHTTQQFSDNVRQADNNNIVQSFVSWSTSDYTWFLPVAAKDGGKPIALTSSNAARFQDGKLTYTVNRR